SLFNLLILSVSFVKTGVVLTFIYSSFAVFNLSFNSPISLFSNEIFPSKTVCNELSLLIFNSTSFNSLSF
ncbi:MAG: hypothetical protein SOY58_05480, partial [Candidatus Onthovivens sp.]|nr:hypothetical protein [Candidatus Onthovivens sp.]